MKCGKWSKYHKYELKSKVYPSEKHEISVNSPEMKISSFRDGRNQWPVG